MFADNRHRSSRIARRMLFTAVVACALLVAGASQAEQAWVKGEVTLNLRTGPGTQFRIVHSIKTGDEVSIMERADRWTKVLLPDGKQGWVPVGYLNPKPPPTVRLAKLEEEVETLRTQLDTTASERDGLKTRNEELASRDEGQRSEVERLTMENMDLRAGERWPYLIAGALILAAGMVVGSIMHAISSSRRNRPRVRL